MSIKYRKNRIKRLASGWNGELKNDLLMSWKIPDDLFAFLVDKLELNDTQNLIPGGRYHNFKDFISFPSLGNKHLTYDSLPALKVAEFEAHRSIFKVLKEKDVFLTYPYQSFGSYQENDWLRSMEIQFYQDMNCESLELTYSELV